jgi:hypothetical protein
LGPTSLQGKAHHSLRESRYTVLYTDKKENKIFLINKEIQKGAFAKMSNSLLIQYMTKYLRISSYTIIRKAFFKYDFATAPI